MPPKKAPAIKAASVESKTSERSSSKKKYKKPPSTSKAKAILDQRDRLIERGLNPETVGLACKGLFGCDKKVDEKCLDGIKAKLDALEASHKQGGSAKRKPRKRSKSRGRKH